MGEIADMMLDGTLCECCGVYIETGEPPGFPRYCSQQCLIDRTPDLTPERRAEYAKTALAQRGAKQRERIYLHDMSAELGSKWLRDRFVGPPDNLEDIESELAKRRGGGS